jgi:hypothetical protein
MVRSLASLFALLVSLSLSAQPLRFNPERQVSGARLGVPGYKSSLPSCVASNGETFLAVWSDNRAPVDSLSGSFGWVGQAMRLGPDGTPLDAQSIYLPIMPHQVIWAGTYWVVIGTGGIVRIGADGVLIDRQPRKVPSWYYGSIAWTGDGFVMAATPGPTYGLRVATLDTQLRLVEERVVTDFSVELLGVAGDGQSAIIAYCKYGFDDQPVRGASFGRNGLLVKNEILYSRAGLRPGFAAIGASDAGTLLVIHNGKQQEALMIGRDLQTRHIGTIGITDKDPAYAYARTAPVLAWDGVNFTFVSVPNPYTTSDLVATRISGDGHYVDSAKLAPGWVSSSRPFSVAAVSGRTLLLYDQALGLTWEDPSVPKVRSFATPSAFASTPDVALLQGAFSQSNPAAASSATQSLVVWRERTTPLGSQSVFATRLDANGAVLDPQSILLSSESCAGVAPAVVSDGRDFIVVWAVPGYIKAARVASDGTVTRKSASYTRDTNSCPGNDLALATNGSNFLAVWAAMNATQPLNDLFVAPFSADFGPDGSLPVEAIQIGLTGYGRFLVASDGHDYLVAGGNHAARVTADGLSSGFTQDVLLGNGSANAMWWNGTRYVVWTSGSDGKSRFLRIGTNGSGSVNPFGPQPEGISMPAFPANPFATVCDAGGCWLSMATVEDHNLGVTMLRLDDDGTTVKATLHPVDNASIPTIEGDRSLPAGVVSAGNLLVVRNVPERDKPYSGVYRVVVSSFAPSRSRSVRH